jgi:RNA polymerase sigma-70 factor (ECF subfamily)
MDTRQALLIPSAPQGGRANMQAQDTELSAWLAQAAAGDQGALRRIYQAEGSRLYGIALKILRERSAAQDALQDAFVAVWQRARQFDPARGSARVWLAAVVRHRALDLARARGRETLSDDPGLGDEAITDDPTDRIAAAADGARLAHCLGGLEEKNRRSIVLAFVDGMSHAQVAEKLGLPLGTVKAWIRRGLLSLRACMEGAA